MPALPIIIGQDAPVLHVKTATVPKVTKEVLKLIRDMEETVKAADGLGLAAPQIGKSLRLCLVKLGSRFVPLVNPQITFHSKETDTAEEGCLSLPDIWLPVERATTIIVRYHDARGQEQERRLEGLEARIVQHEVDHLDGILITDHQPAQKPM